MGADSRPVSRRLQEIVVAAKALPATSQAGCQARRKRMGICLGTRRRACRSVIGPLERASAVPRRAPSGHKGSGGGESARSPEASGW